MSEPNYDARLEPKYRRRDQQEIDDLVKQEWRLALEATPADQMLRMLPAHLATDHIGQIIDDVIDNCNPKFADPEFYASIAWSDLEYEER